MHTKRFALATAATVFIIALGYNQVIQLFPTGGGGYRVATDRGEESGVLECGVAVHA